MTGKVWLFYFGWGFREVHGLGEIRNGRVAFSVDASEWFDGTRPDAFAIVVEVPRVGWYRTHDIDDIRATAAAIGGLGRSHVVGGIHVIELPPPTRQTVRTLNADGSPRAHAAVDVEMWVTDTNHCGVHEGFADWRYLTTDAAGVATFVAPLSPLYVVADYYKRVPGLSRRVLERQTGERMDAGRVHVLRGDWDPPLPRTFHIHIETAERTPATVAILPNDRACMSPAREIGSTNSQGDLDVTFVPELVRGLTIVDDGRAYNTADDFTEDEMSELVSTGSVSVTRPRRPR